MPLLQPGDAAPDPEAFDIEGRPVRLSAFWQQGPAVLAFLRHFG